MTYDRSGYLCFRKLISLYNLSCTKLSELKLVRPMWVLCSDLNGAHLAFLSSYVKSSRSIINFSVTVQGANFSFST